MGISLAKIITGLVTTGKSEQQVQDASISQAIVIKYLDSTILPEAVGIIELPLFFPPSTPLFSIKNDSNRPFSPTAF